MPGTPPLRRRLRVACLVGSAILVAGCAARAGSGGSGADQVRAVAAAQAPALAPLSPATTTESAATDSPATEATTATAATDAPSTSTPVTTSASAPIRAASTVVPTTLRKAASVSAPATVPVAATAAPARAPAPPAAAPAAPAGSAGQQCSSVIAEVEARGLFPAPGFAVICPGYAAGHMGMTCFNNATLCPGIREIVISNVAPFVVANEFENSWILSGEGTPRCDVIDCGHVAYGF